MKATAKGQQERERNGQYGAAIDWEAVCKCGRKLGEHLAEWPHDLDDDETSCEGFRKARKSPVTARPRE